MIKQDQLKKMKGNERNKKYDEKINKTIEHRICSRILYISVGFYFCTMIPNN